MTASPGINPRSNSYCLKATETITRSSCRTRSSAARRYKMVYEFFPDQTDPVIEEYGTLPSMACAVSAGGRTGTAHASYDFDNWPDLWQWAFALPEPADPEQRDAHNAYDQVHLGVGVASFGNVCVGVYGIWHSQAFGENFGKISCDLGLLVSNDGVRFREPGATLGQVFIHHDDSPVTPTSGCAYNTELCQGNGILNVGDETRIYHGRWRNVWQNAEDVVTHYHAEVALATLPRDRWGGLGLNPGVEEGTICSRLCWCRRMG